MREISPVDWDQLERLAGRVGIPCERVGALRQRMDANRPRPGCLYTLLVGCPDGGVEVLLARWVSPDAADALQGAGDRPLVIGAEPDKVRPALGAWPNYRWPALPTGHLILVRTAARPAADLLAQLASLGHADLLVVVTRLGQPLKQVEREFAQSLGPLAATARVLIVGLAGEEPTDGDLAEVTAFAARQMRLAGLHSGRYLGAAVVENGRQQTGQ